MCRSALRSTPFGPFDPIGPSSRAVGPLAGRSPDDYGHLMVPLRPIDSAARAAMSQRWQDEVFAFGARRSAPAIRIRRIAQSDQEGLQAFYAGLSDESRRTRFLGQSRGIGADQSTYFCTPDHAHREGFVAVTGAMSRPNRIVGHICVEPDGAASAEVAVAVADEMQGLGIGRRLVDAAVAWARVDGIETLTATMLAGNPAIQRLLTSLGLQTTAVPIGSGVIEVRIELGVVRSAA
jgi:GNAT superfamily N-acetyltransferase